MRVVAGSAKGTPLSAPGGMNTRPTTDKVKEGVFSALQFYIPGSAVLDLFAGSGGMGIEALSRGAESCVFIDSDSSAVRVINDNLRRCNMKATVLMTDAIRYIAAEKRKFDIIFTDPPYNKGLTAQLIEYAPKLLNDSGLLVCETDNEEPRPVPCDGLTLRREYKYGRVIISVFVKGSL